MESDCMPEIGHIRKKLESTEYPIIYGLCSRSSYKSNRIICLAM